MNSLRVLEDLYLVQPRGGLASGWGLLTLGVLEGHHFNTVFRRRAALEALLPAPLTALVQRGAGRTLKVTALGKGPASDSKEERKRRGGRPGLAENSPLHLAVNHQAYLSQILLEHILSSPAFSTLNASQPPVLATAVSTSVPLSWF